MKNKEKIVQIEPNIDISFISSKILLGIIIFLLILQPLQAQSQTQPNHFDPVEFDAYIQQAMKDWDVPGLSISVIKEDSVVFMKGYGVREIGKPGLVKMHVHTVVRTPKGNDYGKNLLKQYLEEDHEH